MLTVGAHTPFHKFKNKLGKSIDEGNDFTPGQLEGHEVGDVALRDGGVRSRVSGEEDLQGRTHSREL